MSYTENDHIVILNKETTIEEIQASPDNIPRTSLEDAIEYLGGNLEQLLNLSDSAGLLHNDGSCILAWGLVITADITDKNVTFAKIQDVSATSRILGRITAGAGVIEELTAANVKTILALAQADITGLKTADSPIFATVKLSGLTDGYLPYHVSDASGLANSPIFCTSTLVGIGISASLVHKLHVLSAGTTEQFKISHTGDLGSFGVTVYSADNVWVSFDADYVVGWKSRDADSNFAFNKAGDVLTVNYDTSVALGGTVTWNIGATFGSDGSFKVATGFGCNGKTAQTAYASGGAVTTGAGDFGFASDAERAALNTLVTNIRAALVANGIMS